MELKEIGGFMGAMGATPRIHTMELKDRNCRDIYEFKHEPRIHTMELKGMNVDLSDAATLAVESIQWN